MSMPIKVIFVGENGTGKSAVIHRALRNEYSENVPSVNNCLVDVKVDDKVVTLSMWDTESKVPSFDSDRLRILSYFGTDVFVVLFSLNNRLSFEKVADRWKKELREHCADASLILVGNKCDLPEDQRKISLVDALEMQNRIGAKLYLEVSAKTGKNIDVLMQRCASIVLKKNELRRHHIHGMVSSPIVGGHSPSMLSPTNNNNNGGVSVFEENELRFGVELLPANTGTGSTLFNNFKLNKVIMVRLDENDVNKLKNEIEVRFGNDLTEAKKGIVRLQYYDGVLKDFYDLDDLNQIIDQRDRNVKLRAYFE
ncbi:hypothetical protein ABK040_006926 [Willaertia magna]